MTDTGEEKELPGRGSREEDSSDLYTTDKTDYILHHRSVLGEEEEVALVDDHIVEPGHRDLRGRQTGELIQGEDDAVRVLDIDLLRPVGILPALFLFYLRLDGRGIGHHHKDTGFLSQSLDHLRLTQTGTSVDEVEVGEVTLNIREDIP